MARATACELVERTARGCGAGSTNDAVDDASTVDARGRRKFFGERLEGWSTLDAGGEIRASFRALTRETWQQIRARTREPGPAFSPEMMCAALQARCRVIEVPVSYGNRMGGESKHSDTFRRQATLAWKMFRTICRKRFLERGAPLPSPEVRGA